MVEAYEGGGFGHAVALHHGVAQAFEEVFGAGGQRGATADEGPKLPAEFFVNCAEEPGAAQEFFVRGSGEEFREIFWSVPFEAVAQEIEDSWDGD